MTDEEKRSEELSIIENYRPIDDIFMRSLFRNNLKLTEEVIRIVTNLEGLKITKEFTQYDISRLLGSRSVCLDVFCTNEDGGEFNIEIQRIGKDMPPERVRYHISAIDVDFLKAGADFKTLPTVYVIVFSEEDPYGLNQLFYVFERTEQNSNIPFNDRTHIIIVNCAYDNPDDNSSAANLARDFLRKNPDEMFTKVLADTVRHFKSTTEGVSDMCRTIDELEAKIVKEVTENVTREVTENVTKEVTENVTKKNAIDMALKLLGFGVEKEIISKTTGFTFKELEELAQL